MLLKVPKACLSFIQRRLCLAWLLQASAAASDMYCGTSWLFPGCIPQYCSHELADEIELRFATCLSAPRAVLDTETCLQPTNINGTGSMDRVERYVTCCWVARRLR